ncbi:DUF2382 domain-containing protein [Streptomyces halobius]|uniref:PRC and DUF2382 domain-containing protein n=1 Tax=Streptomyces halobius TaxID=2879846 RepID=A0ABY4M714_9ACTN|nr:PRC and DUF2382 domain-containing protein [Streptomyces halobius]UQA92953.1 PRC and DUF2382 domain-containing protein [Streptomyces halobius]
MNAPLGDIPQPLTGSHVVDAAGARVGTVQQVYRDDATNEPEWITVRTGLFGMKETFIPLAGARRAGSQLRVPHTKDVIKEAPRIDAEGHLDPSEEEELYRHYGMTRPAVAGSAMRPEPRPEPGPGLEPGPEPGLEPGPPPSPPPGMTEDELLAERARYVGIPERDHEFDREMPAVREGRMERPLAGTAARAEVTRGRGEEEARRTEQPEEIVLYGERIEIGTEERESGRAHLRKHVVTEEVHRTVQLSHEEVRVVRTKITDEERAAGRTAPRLGEGEVEVVLHEERPVINKRMVPVERVRLETERVTEQKEVTAEIRREELELDDGRGVRRTDPKGTGRDLGR